MDARRQKAHELADRARITFADGCYTVPSQSGNGKYTVILGDDGALCDCPDFELRGKPCKHIMGVRLFVQRQARGAEQSKSQEPAPKLPRKTYQQDWPNYNLAQTNEQRHFQDLLADLCNGIQEPARTGRGRKPVPLADQVYAATMKVYSLSSARRFMSQLEEAVERGHVSKGMQFNAVNAVGGTLYAPFKINATGGVGGLFEEMFLHFLANREGFLNHYHQRSNVESTISMVKRKFGDFVRSKGDVAMKNEVLCKILAHNICRCIAAWYELGIAPVFSTEEEGGSPAVLPMRRPS